MITLPLSALDMAWDNALSALAADAAKAPNLRGTVLSARATAQGKQPFLIEVTVRLEVP